MLKHVGLALLLLLPLLAGCTGLSESVQIQMITSATTVVAIVVSAWVQKRWTNAQTDKLAAGTREVHALVDGKASEQERKIDALKHEISRLSRPGEAGTTEQVAGEGGALVGLDHGVVTVERQRRDQRESDVKVRKAKT